MLVNARDDSHIASPLSSSKRPPFTRSISDTPTIQASVPSSPTNLSPPQRPPRNPARPPSTGASFFPPVGKQAESQNGRVSRPRTATGTREEVTPWELYPPPPVVPTSALASQAGPSTSKRVPGTQAKPARPQSSSGSSHSPSLSFGEFSLLRRRKSLGSKPKSPAHVLHKPRAQPATTSTLKPAELPPQSQSDHDTLTRPLPGTNPTSSQQSSGVVTSQSNLHTLSPPSTTQLHHTPPHHPHRHPPHAEDSTGSNLHKPPSPVSQKEINLKFSTADRTILEELKRSINAKASQFVLKGAGGVPTPTRDSSSSFHRFGGASSLNTSTTLWGSITGPRKHHPYPKDEVPYPKSYEREILDLDVWENLFCQQVCKSVTWHVFEKAPSKVLDIGCGTGTWILDCARVWRQTHFVGFDVVPLHPDLQQVGSADLARRVTWHQGNFLEGLPFPNEEFDFVHIKRIGMGVPEDKWDYLFEEITRVMKPGAAFEMIEEDLFFPGRIDDDDTDDSEMSDDQLHHLTTLRRRSLKRISGLSSSTYRYNGFPRDEPWSDHEREDNDQEYDSDIPSSPSSRRTVGGRVSDSPTNSVQLSQRPPSPIPAPPIAAIAEDEEGEKTATLPSPVDTEARRFHLLDPTVTTTSTVTNGETVQSKRRRQSLSRTTPISIPPNPYSVKSLPSSPTTGRSVLLPLNTRALPMSSAHGAAHLSLFLPSKPQSVSQTKLTGSTTSLHQVPHSSPLSASSTSSLFIPSTRESLEDTTYIGSPSSVSVNTKPAVTAPLLLRTLPKPPTNPRDHSLLEMIYQEMHASRFINLAPLSLLPNLLGIHFKDVRTHPPLQFSFPPPTPTQDKRASDVPSLSDSSVIDSDPDEEAHDAIRPAPSISPQNSRVRKRQSTLSEHQRYPRISSPVSTEFSDAGSGDEEEPRWISMQNLLTGQSSYVSIDGARASAFSPSRRASFKGTRSARKSSNASMTDGVPGRTVDAPSSAEPPSGLPAGDPTMFPLRMPNNNLNVDVRSLNLHLGVRVGDVLGCTESMWEWVVEYQRKTRRQKTTRGEGAARARSRSIDFAPSREPRLSSAERLKNAIMDLTREEYDDLVKRFYLDMTSHIAIGSNLESNFAWHAFKYGQSSERKAFEAECAKYNQWEREQKHHHHNPPPRRRSRPLSASLSPLPSIIDLPTPKEMAEGPLLNPERPFVQNLRESLISTTSKSRASVAVPKSPSLHSTLPQSRRKSRAMRVFVAWKG
ncbi:hypothetical protein D9758_002781 [Tetrapyrgos nigripes]|uniref:Methyltransferase domain-containing protein n=1 Tax=Tetrapyrgos nigripes TaxID=182062 RepID=A0A8H5GR97_9AGAR|nr:hypothetical protein D9758_002781 [Tetrapyrgos nigripes]